MRTARAIGMRKSLASRRKNAVASTARTVRLVAFADETVVRWRSCCIRCLLSVPCLRKHDHHPATAGAAARSCAQSGPVASPASGAKTITGAAPHQSAANTDGIAGRLAFEIDAYT